MFWKNCIYGSTPILWLSRHTIACIIACIPRLMSNWFIFGGTATEHDGIGVGTLVLTTTVIPHNNFHVFQKCATLRMAAVTGSSTQTTTGIGFDSRVPAPLTTPGQAVTTPPTHHMAITSLCLRLLRMFRARQLKCPQLFTLQVRRPKRSLAVLAFLLWWSLLCSCNSFFQYSKTQLFWSIFFYKMVKLEASFEV